MVVVFCNKTSFAVLTIFLCTIFVIPADVDGAIRTGFYDARCPSAEAIVRQTVTDSSMWNPGIIPGLIRLHFHDCFVRGCDASILLDRTPSGEPVEKDSPFNGATLRGLEVLDNAKAQLEATCPGTVSCSDILAFAARDAAYLAGIPDYAVPAGRLDGRVSLASEVPNNLPTPAYNLTTLTNLFASKGISQEDMIILSGAHSIGRAHCQTFRYRLYNFSPSQPQEPSLDPVYADYLKSMCPDPALIASDPDMAVNLNGLSGYSMDNMYYVGVTQGKGLLGSDQALMESRESRRIVRSFANDRSAWATRFVQAMVKVGRLEGQSEGGEVRNNCRWVN